MERLPLDTGTPRPALRWWQQGSTHTLVEGEVITISRGLSFPLLAFRQIGMDEYRFTPCRDVILLADG